MVPHSRERRKSDEKSTLFGLLFFIAMTAVSNLSAVAPVALPPAWGLNKPAANWSISDNADVDAQATTGNADASVKVFYYNANGNEVDTTEEAAVPKNSVRLDVTVPPPASGFWPHIGNAVGTETDYEVRLVTASGVEKGSAVGKVTRTQP